MLTRDEFWVRAFVWGVLTTVVVGAVWLLLSIVGGYNVSPYIVFAIPTFTALGLLDDYSGGDNF